MEIYNLAAFAVLGESAAGDGGLSMDEMEIFE
jgi:hypothetical protein